jgi:hypothetical protein
MCVLNRGKLPARQTIHSSSLEVLGHLPRFAASDLIFCHRDSEGTAIGIN